MIIMAFGCDGATIAHFSGCVIALVRTANQTVKDLPY